MKTLKLDFINARSYIIGLWFIMTLFPTTCTINLHTGVRYYNHWVISLINTKGNT
jgi:hypothetical protein